MRWTVVAACALGFGCEAPRTPPAPTRAAAVPESTTRSQRPVTNLPPNELGEVLVLEYHRLGDREDAWYRSAAHFRQDLEELYRRGFRPILVRDLARGHIDVPAGATPVIFTFDDSSLGQFYVRADGSIEPHTFLGIWEEFRRRHSDWWYGAVWCILPGADYPSNFFGERPSREIPRAERERRIRWKVRFLVEHRHEICNHTLYHARLDRGSDAQVQEWIGAGEDSLRAYLPPDYRIVTLALPLGMWPRRRELAWQGTYRGGRRYRYDVVLEVSGGPNPSPFDRTFDPHRVKRFIVAPGALERQLARYDREPWRRFVSDGDPDRVTVPANLRARLDPQRVGSRRVVIGPPLGPTTATAPDRR